MAERRLSATRTERLMRICGWFREGWEGSTLELAQACQVSQRTAQRDMLSLQGEGFRMPLVVKRVWMMMDGSSCV
jgi:predicted DNA-binding transcriptional regulator YafY